jgi:hypothetical protein
MKEFKYYLKSNKTKWVQVSKEEYFKELSFLDYIEDPSDGTCFGNPDREVQGMTGEALISLGISVEE